MHIVKQLLADDLRVVYLRIVHSVSQGGLCRGGWRCCGDLLILLPNYQLKQNWRTKLAAFVKYEASVHLGVGKCEARQLTTCVDVK